SEISFFIEEGYRQKGFHSSTSSDSSRSISESWLVEESGTFETLSSEMIAHPPTQPSEMQPPFSPTIFLVSDIEESELISDCDLPSPAIKRLNPEQQNYLNNSSIGSSSAPAFSRSVTNEELSQWINVYQPAKKFKLDNLELPPCSPSINYIIGTLNSTTIEDNDAQPTIRTTKETLSNDNTNIHLYQTYPKQQRNTRAGGYHLTFWFTLFIYHF
ncbi:hypothetical protein MKW92_017075, partial [Papaver armeniacum]